MLTPAERKVYALNGIGKQMKEIADLMKSSYETAKCHMKSVKSKLGLQKDKEVTAHFWCNLTGEDFEEVRRQITASCLMLIFVVNIPFFHHQMREGRTETHQCRTSVSGRRNEII